jgi:hypothetical protein
VAPSVAWRGARAAAALGRCRGRFRGIRGRAHPGWTQQGAAARHRNGRGLLSSAPGRDGRRAEGRAQQGRERKGRGCKGKGRSRGRRRRPARGTTRRVGAAVPRAHGAPRPAPARGREAGARRTGRRQARPPGARAWRAKGWAQFQVSTAGQQEIPACYKQAPNGCGGGKGEGKSAGLGSLAGPPSRGTCKDRSRALGAAKCVQLGGFKSLASSAAGARLQIARVCVCELSAEAGQGRAAARGARRPPGAPPRARGRGQRNRILGVSPLNGDVAVQKRIQKRCRPCAQGRARRAAPPGAARAVPAAGAPFSGQKRAGGRGVPPLRRSPGRPTSVAAARVACVFGAVCSSGSISNTAEQQQADRGGGTGRPGQRKSELRAGALSGGAWGECADCGRQCGVRKPAGGVVVRPGELLSVASSAVWAGRPALIRRRARLWGH